MLHDDDDISSNPTETPAFADILAERLSRRGFLGAAAAAGGVAMATSPLAMSEALANGSSTLTFKEVKQGVDEKLHVAEGYDAQVLIRWGDKVLPDELAHTTPASADTWVTRTKALLVLALCAYAVYLVVNLTLTV